MYFASDWRAPAKIRPEDGSEAGKPRGGAYLKMKLSNKSETFADLNCHFEARLARIRFLYPPSTLRTSSSLMNRQLGPKKAGAFELK